MTGKNRAKTAACALLALLVGPMAAQPQASAAPSELEYLTVEMMKEHSGRQRKGEHSAAAVKFSPLRPEERQRAGVLRRQLGTMVSSRISDLELLGMHARNERERSLYAEQFALRYRAVTHAVLRFDAAVGEAHRRLFGDVAVFDPDKWQLPGFRWRLKLGGIADSEQVLRRVLQSAHAGQKSYIQLIGSGQEEAVQWIRRTLPASLVRQGRFEVSLAPEQAGLSEGLELLTPSPSPNPKQETTR